MIRRGKISVSTVRLPVAYIARFWREMRVFLELAHFPVIVHSIRQRQQQQQLPLVGEAEKGGTRWRHRPWLLVAAGLWCEI